MPYKTQSCLDGSYVKCNTHGSFGGHFLTLPFIISFLNQIIGYNHNNVFYINFVVSLLLLVSLIVWNEKNRHDNKSIINTNILLTLTFNWHQILVISQITFSHFPKIF